ncbi:MAG: hypothetical protein ACUVTX_09260 [Bacteroidales bacterium]
MPALINTIKNGKLITGEARYKLTGYINYSVSLLRSRTIMKGEFLGKCETWEMYNIATN